ncbi:MAG TPA: DUF3617 family protein [Rhodocyclaceae bacterium]|nr:DUF3617 family protein [Rhodocyclaceae bacterium]
MYKTIFAASLALATGLAGAQGGDELPRRDPGLWEMSTSMVEMGGLGMNMQACIDESVEDLMMQAEADSDCSEQSYRRDGERIVFAATCMVDGSRAQIDGVFTGNFAKHYEGEVRTTYTPPLEGMATTHLKMAARWIGACKPGQQPGEVVMTGMTGMGDMNFDDLMQRMQEMQPR